MDWKCRRSVQNVTMVAWIAIHLTCLTANGQHWYEAGAPQAAPKQGHAKHGHLNGWLRSVGYGWSDGYHADSRPAASPGPTPFYNRPVAETSPQSPALNAPQPSTQHYLRYPLSPTAQQRASNVPSQTAAPLAPQAPPVLPQPTQSRGPGNNASPATDVESLQAPPGATSVMPERAAQAPSAPSEPTNDLPPPPGMPSDLFEPATLTPDPSDAPDAAPTTAIPADAADVTVTISPPTPRTVELPLSEPPTASATPWSSEQQHTEYRMRPQKESIPFGANSAQSRIHQSPAAMSGTGIVGNESQRSLPGLNPALEQTAPPLDRQAGVPSLPTTQRVPAAPELDTQRLPAAPELDTQRLPDVAANPSGADTPPAAAPSDDVQRLPDAAVITSPTQAETLRRLPAPQGPSTPTRRLPAVGTTNAGEPPTATAD